MGRHSKKVKKKKSAASVTQTKSETNTQKYSVDDLLDKAEEYIDRFEFSLAQKFCERALEIDGDNVRALETSASLLLELGNMDAAKQCFGRAIEVQPDVGHEKYMCMGQLLTGEYAINCFQKGIELMKKLLAESEAAAGASKPDVTPRDIARAYCNIAEIYLTDECFDDEADVKCKQNLDNAMATDPDYPECSHLLASFWLSKAEPDKAKEAMDKGVLLWLPKWKENVKNDVDIAEVCPIGYPERINATKILIELKEYELSTEVLELLLDEDDNIVETWYLLGWVNYLQGDDYYTNARFYLQKAQKVAKETQCEDEGLVKHINELVQELGPGEEKDEEEQNGDNNVEMSDIESDNDENGDSMEH